MCIYDSCKSAVQSCLATKTFAVARLYNDEETMNIHIHDCYEIYFSISGGRQFLIDDRFYEFGPGDIFLINQYESHCISQADKKTHERVVVSIHPEYLERFSTEQTDLKFCFTCREMKTGHRITLSEEERKRFLYYVHRYVENKGAFGEEILDQVVFLEMMVYLNQIFLSHYVQDSDMAQKDTFQSVKSHHTQIDEILSYINQHLTEDLSIPLLADQIYVSSSYLCKIFKEETGTTINRYTTAKRISYAKYLLADGHSAMETSGLCGFKDYSSFLRSFTKNVGVTPKQYASYVQ